MENELALLQTQVNRLQSIIDILLEDNTRLRALSRQNNMLEGKDESIISDLIQSERNIGDNTSNLTQTAGKSGAYSSNLAVLEGNMGNNSSNLTTAEGKSMGFSSGVAAGTSNININSSLLQDLLRKEMIQSRNAGPQNAALLLIHFYKQPRNTHHHLCTLTHMTLSGVAKHIHMLKKRNLIVRSGFQTYTLTAKAMNLIQQCMQPA